MFTDAYRADMKSNRGYSLRLAAAEALGSRIALHKDGGADVGPAAVEPEPGLAGSTSGKDAGKTLDPLLERLLADRSAAPMREALLAAIEVDLGGVTESPVFRNRILSYRAQIDIIEKHTVEAESARREYEALQVLNEHMAARGLSPVFPRVYFWSKDPPAVAMEHIKGQPFYKTFQDDRWRDGSGERQDSWRRPLTALFGQLAQLYTNSLRSGAPVETGYIYGRRFSHVVGREDFLATFAACFDGEARARRWEFAELAAMPISVNGERRRAYGDYAARLLGDGRVAEPSVRCLVHGDLHAANVMCRERDGLPILIDPRCDWDGHPLAETAVGDPLLDAAFIYHSLELMGPLLSTLRGRPFRGAEIREEQRPGGAETELRVPLLFGARHPFPKTIHALCMDYLPSKSLIGDWRHRLHVGIACAYLGWLKHRRIVQDARRWLSVYGAVLWHLGIAEEMRDVGRPMPPRRLM